MKFTSLLFGFAALQMVAAQEAKAAAAPAAPAAPPSATPAPADASKKTPKKNKLQQQIEKELKKIQTKKAAKQKSKIEKAELKAEAKQLKKEANKQKVAAAKAEAQAKNAPGENSKSLKQRKAEHAKAVGSHLNGLLKKRREASKKRSAQRADKLKEFFKPRVLPYHPGYNPHYYNGYERYYQPATPIGERIVIPACPNYQDWLNSRYYHKIKEHAIRSRYAFARNHCLRKGLSMKQRYECFKIHWKQYKPGTKNSIHQVRNRVQRDCMKYKYNAKLRRQCFKAHVKHYKKTLLAEQNDDDFEDDQDFEDDAVDADESAGDESGDDDSLILVKVSGPKPKADDTNDEDDGEDGDSGSD